MVNSYTDDGTYKYEHLVVDTNLREVFVNGRPVKFNKTDFEILLLLAKQRMRVP
jgi:DNA-binding response OmpR family regulator